MQSAQDTASRARVVYLQEGHGVPECFLELCRAEGFVEEATLVGVGRLLKDPEAVEDYFKLGYRGARFAFGYGACPNLEDRAKMMELLEPGRIGVTLSEELQLHPEQSTDAFVLHHPEAKYFNV